MVHLAQAEDAHTRHIMGVYRQRRCPNQIRAEGKKGYGIKDPKTKEQTAAGGQESISRMRRAVSIRMAMMRR